MGDRYPIPNSFSLWSADEIDIMERYAFLSD